MCAADFFPSGSINNDNRIFKSFCFMLIWKVANILIKSVCIQVYFQLNHTLHDFIKSNAEWKKNPNILFATDSKRQIFNGVHFEWFLFWYWFFVFFFFFAEVCFAQSAFDKILRLEVTLRFVLFCIFFIQINWHRLFASIVECTILQIYQLET